MAADADHPFFADHAISPDVACRRGYARWTPENIEPVRQAYLALPQPGKRGTMTRRAREAGSGWVIKRWAPPDCGADPQIFAEIRPDNPVVTKTTYHVHGDDPEALPIYRAEKLRPDNRSLESLHKRLLFNPHPDVLEAHLNREKSRGGHGGDGAEGMHVHVKSAKYLFPPNLDKSWTKYHDHDEYKTSRGRAEHIDRRHDGLDVQGRHKHTHKAPDRENGLAKRLDVHPDALPLIEERRRVYFALEGCIKADAILSRDAAVFSVPSVTLWDAPELEGFARRYLQEKQVIIVVDADGHKNDLVMTEAYICQSRLEELGVEAYVAAPPFEEYEKNEELKGVDDHLVHEGTLADLTVYRREARDRVQTMAELAEAQQQRWNGLKRAADTLHALAKHADGEGVCRVGVRKLARIMNTNPRRVSDALRDLRDKYGVITIEGDLSQRQSWFSGEWEWESTAPAIVVAEPYRVKHSECRLGELAS